MTRTAYDGAPVLNTLAEIDRLIDLYAGVPAMHHRLPFLRAIREKKLVLCEIGRGGVPSWREMERIGAKQPVLLIIGDDDDQSTGPVGFPGLERMWRWQPRKAVVHASGAEMAISEDIVASMPTLRRVVLVETSTAHADAWVAWASAFKPSYGVLTIRSPGGIHPAPQPRN